MIPKAKLVVLRFSAMGDVAMVASVLREFSAQHPAIEVIMVSRSIFRPFFEDIPGVSFHEFHPKGIHKGVFGLYSLYQELRAYKAQAVADLHDTIRSRFVSLLFRLGGVEIARIDKGRAEKKALTRTRNKLFKPLKSTVERYAEVFGKLGFGITLSHRLQRNQKALPNDAISFFGKEKAVVGISPFAQHASKVYDLGRMEQVIARLNDSGIRLLIFGGGEQERMVAAAWESQYANVSNLIGSFTISDELAIISHLDLMISMDSSGMHMASLMGIPVISLWGGTHPYAGFLGYGQQMDDCIQVDHPSRPNSVYGDKPCSCDGVPCIDLIEPADVVHRVLKKIRS